MVNIEKNRLFLFDCSYGASVLASAAIDAFGLIDFVMLFSLGNSVYGASCSASAALDALIVDYSGHSKISLIINRIVIL